MRFDQMPPDTCKIDDSLKDKVMHATLEFGDGNTMLFSDSGVPGFVQGTNAHMSLNIPEEEEEEEEEFMSLLEVGAETMPFVPVFWEGKFGIFKPINIDFNKLSLTSVFLNSPIKVTSALRYQSQKESI